MSSHTTNILLVAGIFFLALSSCRKPSEQSPVPELSFKQFVASVDSTDILGNRQRFIELTFMVIDGDGNIGFDSVQVIDGKKYKQNIFLNLYGKKDGKFEIINNEQDSTLKNLKVPYLDSDGYDKTLKADIKIAIEYDIPIEGSVPILPLPLQYDTLMYDCYIIDRELNKSNVVFTAEIIFPPVYGQ